MKKVQKMIFLALLLLLSGCTPGNAPAPQDNMSIETIVAATYAVISAQTQAAQALFTATPLDTATPTNPPLPPTITPTFTPTFVVILHTATPLATFTPLATSTPAVTATPADFDCALVSQKPENGTSMGSRNDFDWFWTVTNTGNKDWVASDIDYVYVSGEEMHKTAAYNLPADVDTGDDIKLGVDMVAPKNTGSYSTTWALKRGSNTFCTVTLKIIVK